MRLVWCALIFSVLAWENARAQIERFTETFERGSEVWRLEPGWSVTPDRADSRNHVLRGNGPGWAVLQAGQNWRDYALRFRFRVAQGHLRACFRISAGNMYAFELSAVGAALDKLTGNARPVRLASPSKPVSPGGWHTAEIRVQGGTIVTAVDGERAEEVRDRRPLGPGGIAFEVPHRSSVDLDDIEVSVDALGEPGEPDEAAVTALREEGRRLASLGEDFRKYLGRPEEEFLAAQRQGGQARREAELRYREALAAAFVGDLQRSVEERRVNKARVKAAAELLLGEDIEFLSTKEFVVLFAKTKSMLLSGAGADLTVKLFEVAGTPVKGLSPWPPLIDRPARLTIVVENKGVEAVGTAFPITLEIDGNLVHTWNFSPVAAGEDPAHSKMPLLPGGSRLYSTSLEFQQPGQHQLHIAVDPKGVIPEIDKSNNTLDITAAWQEPPNLKVRSVTMLGDTGGGQKSTWKIEIENAGKGTAVGPFLTSFQPEVPGGSWENLWTGSLAGGAVAAFTSTQYFRSSGTFVVRATVDASWAVPEAEPGGEADNEWTGSFTLNPVDVVIDDVKVSPDKIVSWRPMTVGITIRNAGTGNASQPFKVRVFPGVVAPNGVTGPRDYMVNSLGAGQSATISHQVTLWPGKYDLSVEADFDRVYFESNNDNNTRVQTIHCQGMRRGRLYVIDGPNEADLIQYLLYDPELAWYRRQVAITGLLQCGVQTRMCDGEAQDKYDASGAWCSEFARWVLLHGGMANLTTGFLSLKNVNVNSQLVTLFDAFGMFRWRKKGEVTPQTLEPGDYLSWSHPGKKKNHASICVAVSQDNKTLWHANGNAGDCVYLIADPYFADGQNPNPENDGVGKIDAGMFPMAPVPAPVWPEWAVGPEGGTGGSDFRDAVPPGARVTKINLRCGGRVDGVQLVLNTGPLGYHGGTGGILNEIALDPGEYIARLHGRAGERVDQVEVITNKRSITCGGTGGGRFAFDPPPDYEIVGFYGRSGTQIDALGVIARPRP